MIFLLGKREKMWSIGPRNYMIIKIEITKYQEKKYLLQKFVNVEATDSHLKIWCLMLPLPKGS